MDPDAYGGSRRVPPGVGPRASKASGRVQFCSPLADLVHHPRSVPDVDSHELPSKLAASFPAGRAAWYHLSLSR